MLLLDTNACIAILNGKSRKLLGRLNALSTDSVGICSVVLGELLFGARKSARASQNLERVKQFCDGLVSLSYDDQAAHHYGLCRNLLEHNGTPIGEADLMIASIGLAHDAVVVTQNTREFSRVPGLRVETFITSP
jgi:tRNA(fMet)-specific endonuclease VapC